MTVNTPLKVADKSSEAAGSSPKLAAIDNNLLRDVKVALEAKLGRATLTVEQMMALKSGSVVTLETGLADYVDLYLNDALVARCEIVAVGEKYGVRIVEIAQVT
jgi:flagellar motor switch protein FliN/FliY